VLVGEAVEGGVSVAEIASRGGEFERTPPHDVAAEQCVLGGMLLSKDAISDVIEVIRPQDHYRPAHQIIHEVVLDLYARGEPADAVTAAAELTKRGDLSRAGGAPYLHTLIASVPTAANAGYYARIVRERAILRRLVEVGTRIVQLGYTGDGDADELVDRAQAEVFGVTDRRVSEDYHPLSEIMPGTLDEIEAIGSRGGGMVGVPTGFGDLDSLTNGLHPGQMIVIAARPAVGKALALGTPLPTPAGWTTMGDVKVGDYLLGADGKPTSVLAATDVMCGRPCFEVEFDDGTVIIADAEHGWLTDTGASRKSAHAAATGHDGYRNQQMFASVKTTRQIAGTVHLDSGDKRLNHSVQIAAALDLPAADVAAPPYVLGVWLAREHSAAACSGSSAGALNDLGVLSNKHIPVPYLRGSEAQRRALLAGLLDMGGAVTGAGSVQFSVTSWWLAESFRELVTSLGYRCGWSEESVRGRSAESSVAYVMTFTTEDDVFRLERKRIMHEDRRPAKAPPRARLRYITAVREVPSVPVRCVQVDNPEHLYLAGRAMIPTHNSTLALDIARAAAVRNGLTTVIFSLEMGRNEITMRLLSAEARVPLHTMRTGQMSDDDWSRLARRMGEVAEAPLFIDDSPNMSMMEIRAKCRRLKQRHDLRIVIVDYMQLMSSPKRVESRQQEVSEMSRALKLLAKELDVPVIAISQLNRGPEQRNDKRPLLSDLRESGSIEQDSDVVILLHREDAYERESPRAGEADLIVAKHRNGPTATVTVAFQGHYSRFVDMAPG
jgi:replicative DNA helicase